MSIGAFFSFRYPFLFSHETQTYPKRQKKNEAADLEIL